MGIALLILGIFAFTIGVALFVKYIIAFVRDKKNNSVTKKLSYVWIGIGLVFAASGALIQAGIHAVLQWNISPGHAAMAIIGQAFFFLFLSTIVSTFIVRYWKPQTEIKSMKWIKIFMFGSIPFLVIFGLLALEGMTPYIEAPYVSGFLIDSSGVHWVYAGKLIRNNAGQLVQFDGGFHVAWYGVLIVFGALVCYWISDHKFYKEFGKHGIVDNILLIAFPAGIIGARIWYVVGNWEKDGFNNNFASVFRIWDGGLTILGGAVAGIIVGVLYMVLRRKYVDIRFAIDVIVPTILIAQAIGRWGNFFNSEVFGKAVYLSQGWDWIPTFITKQMTFVGNISGASQTVYDASGTVALTSYTFLPQGQILVPLFLIEGLLNLAGYFIIVYGVPAIWRKYRGVGVSCALYLIWYGVVRAILENFRNPAFNMGNKGIWSNINSYIYIGIGAVLLVILELYDWYLRKNGKPHCSNQMPPSKKGKVVKKIVKVTKNSKGEVIKREVIEKVISEEEVPSLKQETKPVVKENLSVSAEGEKNDQES